MEKPNVRPMLTLQEVAYILGLDKVSKNPVRVVLQMIARGQLVGVNTGRWVMVTPESVEHLRGVSL